MSQKPLISVLMGIYNCADTLEEAVNCIIDQTYENWELIMCDDCSSDNTYETAKRIAAKDKRIILLKNDKNMTLAPTLNNCLKRAGGEYVARMDGDDICDKERFKKELDILEKYPEYAVVSCKMELFDNAGTFGYAEYREKPKIEDFVSASQVCHAGCMIRKSVLDELNGYNTSSDVERIEDYDLWIRLYAKGYKAYNIQEYLYSMRDDRNAIKRKKFKFRLKEYKLKRNMCKTFNLPLKSRMRCFRPIILGIMPSFVYVLLHKKAHK